MKFRWKLFFLSPFSRILFKPMLLSFACFSHQDTTMKNRCDSCENETANRCDTCDLSYCEKCSEGVICPFCAIECSNCSERFDEEDLAVCDICSSFYCVDCQPDDENEYSGPICLDCGKLRLAESSARGPQTKKDTPWTTISTKFREKHKCT